jgi:hypothetical protein
MKSHLKSHVNKATRKSPHEATCGSKQAYEFTWCHMWMKAQEISHIGSHVIIRHMKLPPETTCEKLHTIFHMCPDQFTLFQFHMLNSHVAHTKNCVWFFRVFLLYNEKLRIYARSPAGELPNICASARRSNGLAD